MSYNIKIGQNYPSLTCYLSFFSDLPIVTLKMGPTLNPEDIKEGDGVYFECDIRSNPKPYKMAWFHDVSILCKYSGT